MRVPLPAAMITMSSAMQRPCPKSAIIGAVLLLTTLLSGCGALRLVYGQAPELVYWWLDGYVDFDSAQSEKVRDDLGPLRRMAPCHPAARLRPAARPRPGPGHRPTYPRPGCAAFTRRAFARSALIERGLPAAADAVMQFRPGEPEAHPAQVRQGQREVPRPVPAARPRRPARGRGGPGGRPRRSLYGRIDAAQSASRSSWPRRRSTPTCGSPNGSAAATPCSTPTVAAGRQGAARPGAGGPAHARGAAAAVAARGLPRALRRAAQGLQLHGGRRSAQRHDA